MVNAGALHPFFWGKGDLFLNLTDMRGKAVSAKNKKDGYI